MKRTIVMLAIMFLAISVSTSCKKGSENTGPVFTPSGQVGYGVADTAANFTEMGFDGTPVSLEDYKGKVIILTFGAMWCGPCRRGVPELVELNNKYKSQGLEIIECVYQDEDGNPCDLSDMGRWMSEFGINYMVFGDDDRSTVDAWGFNSIPFNVVIDRDFVIRNRFSGFSPGTLEAKIKDLL